MSGPIERLVVTFDAASENRPAIDTAVRLAARTGASLHGMFVEDDDLLSLAGLPFACQVTIGRGAEPLSSETIALQLRAAAERTRQELVGEAQRHRVACTFEIVRDEIVRGTSEHRVAGSAEHDLVVTGGLARPIAGHFRVERRRWWPLDAAAGPFLLARGPWTAPGAVVTLLRDRDAGAARVFDIAAQIAAATDSMLAVLCAPALADKSGVEHWIAERAAPHRVRVRVETAPAEPAALRERLGQIDCRVIALDAGLLESGDSALRDLVERFSCDMLVVP
jgi:nucleotide-binding universal stress UspA family protein